MSESTHQHLTLPPEQQAIRDKCFHPSGTFVEFPIEDIETSIPARFEKIVRMYPERIAVKSSTHTFTYERLNRAANRAAHAILAKRDKREGPVALLIENDATMIAAILGVLKAAMIYVPLDPSSPRDRLNFLMQEFRPSLILTDTRNLAVAMETNSGANSVLNIDALDVGLLDENPTSAISADTVAAIFYTSGSTGRPKGVIQSHRSILHRVLIDTNTFHICSQDRLSLLSSPTYSVSLRNLFAALLNGAMVSPINIKEAGLGNLAEWLNREEITIYFSVPTVFRSFAENLTDQNDLHTIRLIYLGGEGATKSDFELYQQHFSPECLFVNSLASNEAGIFRQYFVDKQSEINDEAMLPAGYKVDGKEILLLGDAGQEVGCGEFGEIAVKSRYLSPGYWHEPDLTAATFLPDPKGKDNRVYRTGDLGSLRPDGCLIYLGRKDLRVKIRGARVELEEVETVLRLHASVREAVIAAKIDESGESRLIAYLVPTHGHKIMTTDLRRFLQAKLPDYMLPSRFVIMEALPLTSNGKVDRQALPDPAKLTRDLDTVYLAPRTPVEKTLARIWTTVLEVEPVGVHDNFFELGGHSLLAMRILSAVNRAFGVDISMRNLLDVPTVAELATQIEELRTIGEQRQRHIPPRPLRSASALGGTLPLSYAEEGLWLLEQIRPGLSAWNMQSRLRLRGPIDLKSLQCSLNTLVQRHEILRTAYRLVDEKPARVIVPELTVELEITQLDPSSETDAEIDRIGIADKKQPFTLAEAPLFRIRLVSVNEQDHVLIVTKHHIITDAWSSNVFIREFFSLYDTYTTNRPLALTDLPVQYSDYALWMRQAEQDLMDDQLSYWREKLKGCVVQEIPTDVRRPLERSYRGGQERFQLSKEHSRALQGLCKKERSTLFMLLVAAFKILLSRYTGSSDAVVGSTLAGRIRPELENLIGMFINILTLRTDLSGNPTFRELLGRVRETCLEAYQHQDMAFEKLVQALNPGQGLNHNPFFQVLFNVVNTPPISLALDHLTIESIPRPDDTARFDLSLSAPQNHDGIEVVASYNHNLFNQERIVEMLEQYKFLLEQIVNNPDQTIDQYSLVTPSAQRLLPNPRMPLDDTWQGAVHDLIARHAVRRPEKAALEDPFGVWSYKQLNDLSNQIAHWLIAQGNKRGDIVAVHGQRSATLVSTLLGILKAGTAFCVIDPKHPAGRVKAYLSGTRPKALIEIGGEDNPHAEMEEVLRGASLHSRLQLPGTGPSKTANILSQYSTKNPQIYIGPDDPAYIIFTSGSTGQPKGVMGRHGPLTHFLPWLTETFGLADNDHFSFLSSLSTNKLQREIFTALALGATLHIPSDDTIGNFGTLDEWLRQKEISVIHLTPAMVQLLHDTARESIPSVRKVFFGGDLLQTRDVNLAKNLMPQAEIANFYNSSETQRGGGYFVFSKKNVEHQKDIPPLGQGVKDVQLLVLNQIGALAGVCEVGEICVRSPHLALGYLGDEALTKERFIINPFSGHTSDRIYRTGELGRYLPDGNVEFVARGENQVSIRGYRVDLGEIESVLKSHANILNAVVSPDNGSSDRLIAHLVPKSISIVSIDEMRVFLRMRLPNHMIPAAFVIRDSFPLTATGKIDRRRLAAFNLEKIDEEGMLVSPRNPLEESLANIWSKVLNLDKVGIHNNFFDLGGHSLLAIRVMSLIRNVIGVDLPLRVLFETPTIADLAVIVTKNQIRPLNDPASAQILRDVELMTEEEAQEILST